MDVNKKSERRAPLTSLTGWQPVRFIVRCRVGIEQRRIYGFPHKYTLAELCTKLVDSYSLTEREIAYIVSMRVGYAPFVNGDLYIGRYK